MNMKTTESIEIWDAVEIELDHNEWVLVFWKNGHTCVGSVRYKTKEDAEFAAGQIFVRYRV